MEPIKGQTELQQEVKSSNVHKARARINRQ